jgi:hypothetical protein
VAYARTFDAEAEARFAAGLAARTRLGIPAELRDAVFGMDAAVVHERGVRLVRGALDRTRALALGAQVDALVASGRCLARVRDHAREVAEGRGVDQPAFLDDLAAMPVRSAGVSIADPLVNLPDALALALDRELIGRAAAYYGCLPLLTFCKVRRTFANALPATDTQLWHADGGSLRIFKALVYLNDVEPGGGPFCYVAGSHVRRFDGWLDRDRFDEAEMRARYGDAAVLRLHARAGDVVFAEATGFHCGEKPTVTDRRIMIVNFCLHPEYGFAYEPPRVRPTALADHQPWQRAAAEALASGGNGQTLGDSANTSRSAANGSITTSIASVAGERRSVAASFVDASRTARVTAK